MCKCCIILFYHGNMQLLPIIPEMYPPDGPEIARKQALKTSEVLSKLREKERRKKIRLMLKNLSQWRFMI